MMDSEAKIGVALTFAFTLALVTLGFDGRGIITGENPSCTYAQSFEETAPPWEPAHGYKAKHEYHYYPASHVYWDVARRLYYYDHAGQWRVSASLPGGIHIDVHDYVTLEMDTDKPYEFHTKVVERYPPGQQKKIYKGKGNWKSKGKNK